MKRIAIFQEDFSLGGIQKSLLNLLRQLDYGQVQVDVYLSRKSEFWNVSLPEELRLYYLEPISAVFKFIPFDIGKALVKPDFSVTEEYELAIDFNSYQFSCAIAALTVPAKKRVIWIHTDVELTYRNEWKFRVLWHAFKGKFKYFDKMIAVSKAAIEPFKRLSGCEDKEFDVIGNFINVDEIRRLAAQTPENFSVDSSCMNFVAVGRLCHAKGYDIMLDIFAKAMQQRGDLRLYIVGGGELEESLKSLAVKLGISDKVCFLMGQSNPFAYMNMMDAFISTSRYEGQGMSILEAKAIGLPLYCSRNLEPYCEGLQGRDDMLSALLNSSKEKRKPDDLREYNEKVLAGIEKLVNFM